MQQHHISFETKLRIFAKTSTPYFFIDLRPGKRHGKQSMISRSSSTNIWDRFFKSDDQKKSQMLILGERTAQIIFLETIKKRKWQWIGLNLRRPNNNITKQSLKWIPRGKRRRGQPTNTWRRTTDIELSSCNISWGEVKRSALDWYRWRIVVDPLCPTGRLQE